MKKTIVVTKCDNCPCLESFNEYRGNSCSIAGNLWPMGFYRDGAEAPESCPLRDGDHTITLKFAIGAKKKR